MGGVNEFGATLEALEVVCKNPLAYMISMLPTNCSGIVFPCRYLSCPTSPSPPFEVLIFLCPSITMLKNSKHLLSTKILSILYTSLESHELSTNRGKEKR